MTLVVKLGSSIVAADDGELRHDVLSNVCRQVAELERKGEEVILVTSGAIARGVHNLKLPARPRQMDELQAASAVGQGDLFRAYESRLAEHGTRSAQVLLAASDINERSNYLNARQTLHRLMNWGVVPIVNENDTTATDEITFGDNDFLAAQVAILLDARLLVLLSDVDGLYSADPRLDPGSEPIAKVSDFAELDELEIGDRTSAFGSGGMRSKVEAAKMASAAGIATTICNGTQPDTLRAAAAGDALGTHFLPHPERTSRFKLWIRYAKPVRGRIMVDEGAARALREHASLLPVGIVAIEGGFAVGDAVEVVADGGAIGRGITEYSAVALDEIKGTRSNALAQDLRESLNILDRPEEAIHRDRFVLV